MPIFMVRAHPFTDRDGRVHSRRSTVEVPVAVGLYYSMERKDQPSQRDRDSGDDGPHSFDAE